MAYTLTIMKKIAVIIPCYNEELTIASVIQAFKRELPEAEIFIIDNNCTDKTAEIATKLGVTVKKCLRKGKGAAVRKAFREIDADVFVMVDGDDTYPAEAVHSMLDKLTAGADMVVGDRLTEGDYRRENKRPFHNLGNTLVCTSINLLFQTQLKDVMSGFRVMTRDFVKNCPILVDGFAIETEMSIHAVEKLFQIAEVPIVYRDRPEGSFSKLNTFKDGINVLRAILWVFKDTKPLIFFGALALVQYILACMLFLCSYNAITGTILLLIGSITLGCGLTLDTLAKYHRETFEINMLNKKNYELRK